MMMFENENKPHFWKCIPLNEYQTKKWKIEGNSIQVAKQKNYQRFTGLSA
jgi:hypothetical protein